MSSAFIDVDFDGRPVRIEHAWVGPAGDARPPLVFLHEGLGSLSMWKDFPARLCAALGRRGLVYSRPGYGRSTPRPAGERWGVDFLHRQAEGLLPALLDALGLHGPCVLFGHSDGASIALIHAAALPGRVAALVALAPHILVEASALPAIRATRRAYVEGGLKARLARHHDDPDSAFFGWNDIWLAPEFASWSIEASLPAIRCPVLAVQGVDDEYATMLQIDGIAARIPGTVLAKFDDCGHSPHRDQPDALVEATGEFLGA